MLLFFLKAFIFFKKLIFHRLTIYILSKISHDLMPKNTQPMGMKIAFKMIIQRQIEVPFDGVSSGRGDNDIYVHCLSALYLKFHSVTFSYLR